MDEWDAYFWPNTDVLKNLAGYKTKKGLRDFEYAATRERSEELRRDPIQGRFDTAHYLETHRRLFQDVYEWAGRYRTVDFSKGSTDFAPVETHAHTLASWGEKILGEIAKERHLKDLKTDAFVDRLTYHYGELNYWHPVREGNGRTTKEFLYQIAKQAGYELQYERVREKTWNYAAERQAGGNTQTVRNVFAKITSPARALAFRNDNILDAVKLHPELQGAADALAAAERRAQTLFEGVADRRLFMAEVHVKILERLQSGEIIPARTQGSLRKDEPKDPDFTR